MANNFQPTSPMILKILYKLKDICMIILILSWAAEPQWRLPATPYKSIDWLFRLKNLKLAYANKFPRREKGLSPNWSA